MLRPWLPRLHRALSASPPGLLSLGIVGSTPSAGQETAFLMILVLTPHCCRHTAQGLDPGRRLLQHQNREADAASGQGSPPGEAPAAPKSPPGPPPGLG